MTDEEIEQNEEKGKKTFLREVSWFEWAIVAGLLAMAWFVTKCWFLAGIPKHP